MPIEIADMKLYTLMELTKALKVTTVSLRSYIRQGKLRAKKVGGRWLVSESAIREFLEGEPSEKEERQ